VASARAEARWLEGDLGAIAAETAEVVGLARERGDARVLGDLWTWRRRAGVRDDVDPGLVSAHHALELAGDPLGAARRWDALGAPFDAALARAQSADVGALRQALEAFHQLGAVPAARAVSRRLRQHGVRRVVRGPRRTTMTNPAQLTARQLEILELLGERMSNAEIAGRLYLSPRTVDHHVSAILGKLGVRSRMDAAAEAVRLGIAER
jgi:DNA-binding CsgD family transcriptional regulator